MSNHHDPLDPTLIGIEQALGSLTPAPSRLDRDRLMFRAGQATNQGPSSAAYPRLWKALAASLGIIAVGEAGLLAQRPAVQIVEKVVVVREPAASPVVVSSEVPSPANVVPTPEPATSFRGFEATDPFGSTPYDRLTAQVFRYGLDGLPNPASFRGGAAATDKPWPLPTRQLLQEQLRDVLEPGDPS